MRNEAADAARMCCVTEIRNGNAGVFVAEEACFLVVLDANGDVFALANDSCVHTGFKLNVDFRNAFDRESTVLADAEKCAVCQRVETEKIVIFLVRHAENNVRCAVFVKLHGYEIVKIGVRRERMGKGRA